MRKREIYRAREKKFLVILLSLSHLSSSFFSFFLSPRFPFFFLSLLAYSFFSLLSLTCLSLFFFLLHLPHSFHAKNIARYPQVISVLQHHCTSRNLSTQIITSLPLCYWTCSNDFNECSEGNNPFLLWHSLIDYPSWARSLLLFFINSESILWFVLEVKL